MDFDDNTLTDRVMLLEENVAHHGVTIEELSAQIAAQWKIIDHMQFKLDRLMQQFRALEDATLDAPAITKPPHY